MFNKGRISLLWILLGEKVKILLWCNTQEAA